jgi:hypothetical protein
MFPTVSIEDPGKAAILFGRSVSDPALAYHGHLERRREQLEAAYRFPTMTFAGDRAAYCDAIDQLGEVYTDCYEPDWDGYGAAPIGYDTYLKALAFLEALPSHIPYPDIVPEPDGDLAMEWRGNHEQKLSVSLNAEGRLALLYMPDRLRTTLLWTKPELPKPLLALVELFA